DDIVPLENASMPGRVVIQWDKDDCADMGLIKVDLLGLGMMAVIQDALTLVNGGSQQLNLNLAHLPPDDPAVYKMLQQADTVGIFQVESRAQMATLPRLQPKKFYDIVVEVALIRPGPIVGDMVHPYLKRRQGKEVVTYAHPSLEPILKRTLGVPLFQEQLLRMAMVAAGFSGGEAEELRRAFGFKRSEKRMQQIEGKLRVGMEKQGITGATAEAIIKSITSFALYGFPESHSASFALLVYASAFLKAHYPAAFYTAMLNNQPMGFYHPATLVKDAQRHGVSFIPIDVQESDWECRVEPDGRVRLGLMYVNGLREEAGRAIAARSAIVNQSAIRNPSIGNPQSAIVNQVCPKCGCDDESMLEKTPEETHFCNICAHEWSSEPAATTQAHPESRQYVSIEDLVARAGLRRDELATLADIGALNALGYDRRSALWQIEKAVRPSGRLFEEGLGGPLFNDLNDASDAAEVKKESPLRPMSPPERLMADYSGTSLTIGPHPMALRRPELAMRGVLRATDLPRGRHGRRVRVAGAVITRQRPGTAKGFVFLTLEDETGISNIIVRPDLFTEYRQTIVAAPYLLIEGILQIQEGVTSVKAEYVISLTDAGPEPQSHDFH
ncbi:MAG: error-prone DNA polymerase, partial [Acidobacteriota bacterium]|nr:error-prone DNA polymerase [Acidobacteriota bacterium]